MSFPDIWVLRERRGEGFGGFWNDTALLSDKLMECFLLKLETGCLGFLLAVLDFSSSNFSTFCRDVGDREVIGAEFFLIGVPPTGFELFAAGSFFNGADGSCCESLRSCGDRGRTVSKLRSVEILLLDLGCWSKVSLPLGEYNDSRTDGCNEFFLVVPAADFGRYRYGGFDVTGNSPPAVLGRLCSAKGDETEGQFVIDKLSNEQRLA